MSHNCKWDCSVVIFNRANEIYAELKDGRYTPKKIMCRNYDGSEDDREEDAHYFARSRIQRENANL